MVKIALIVFSTVLVLSIQSVVGLKENLSYETDEGLFYVVVDILMNKLGESKLVDLKVVSDGRAKNVIKETFKAGKRKESLEEAKNANHKLPPAKEKQILCEAIAELIENMGKAKLLDRNAVHKKLFPNNSKALAPEIEAAINEGFKKLGNFWGAKDPEANSNFDEKHDG